MSDNMLLPQKAHLIDNKNLVSYVQKISAHKSSMKVVFLGLILFFFSRSSFTTKKHYCL